MKRMIVFLLGFLCFNASVDAGDPSKNDLERLQGKWKVVTYIEDGKQKDPGAIWQFTGNKLFYEPGSSFHSILELDASKTPKAFDAVTVAKSNQTEKGLKGIYEITGDMVTFCVAQPGTIRPKGFESKEKSGHVLIVLKRVK